VELLEPKLILIFRRYNKYVAEHAEESDIFFQLMKQTLCGIRSQLAVKITKSISKKNAGR